MQDDNKTQGNSDWLKAYGLALEDRVPCDSEDCDGNAGYYSQVSCCGAVLLACTACMKQAGKTVIWMLHHNKEIVCDACGKRNNPKGWMSAPEKL